MKIKIAIISLLILLFATGCEDLLSGGSGKYTECHVLENGVKVCHRTEELKCYTDFDGSLVCRQ